MSPVSEVLVSKARKVSSFRVNFFYIKIFIHLTFTVRVMVSSSLSKAQRKRGTDTGQYGSWIVGRGWSEDKRHLLLD